MSDDNPVIGRTGSRMRDMSHYQLLRCAGVCGRLFTVKVERSADITVTLSDTSDVNLRGYAVYRDSVLIKCPDCKGLCTIEPGSVTIDIKKVK
jgi:hypothetical protein